MKQNTGLTINEYINQRNPETSLPKLFAYVGYNQRTTAVRNFQKITGITPAEFIESIKQ